MGSFRCKGTAPPAFSSGEPPPVACLPPPPPLTPEALLLILVGLPGQAGLKGCNPPYTG